MRMRVVFGTFLIGLVALNSWPTDAQSETDNSLEGAWRVTRITTAAGVNSEPGVALFTRRYYSILAALAPRADLDPEPHTASADQLRSSWGPFMAHSGTYEVVAPDRLVLTPAIAKNPSNTGQGLSVSFKVSKSTLTITDPSGRSINLVRAERPR